MATKKVTKKKNKKTDDPQPFPVVGIGASAGGLEPLKQFLAELPMGFGFALIFVQHQSAGHKSLLAGLLRCQRPDLEIVEIVDGMELLPGRIHLGPPGMDLGIKKGIFQVSAPPQNPVHLPIDELFGSLAVEAEEKAIGVVLSGAGNDGARGVEAIRAGGGTVFVQAPETADYTPMPLAAIATGRVDAVLPPAKIARRILKLHAAPVLEQGTGAISPKEFETIHRLLLHRTGQRFSHYKQSVLARRILRRIFLHSLDSVEEYVGMLEHKSEEPAALAADLMIGVTSFFRDRLAWKALRIGALRKIVTAEEDVPIRVWTPACATGEEAYSVAMMLRDELDLAGRPREIQVFATDVSDRALGKAREGRYPGSIAADVPAAYMRRFFTSSKDGQSVTINKEIRESVLFARQDLLTDPPFSKLDMIICRNLLIYLEPEAQKRCFALFHYALKKGGYLFLGNAESAGRNSRLFKSLAHKKCRIYRRVEAPSSLRMSSHLPIRKEQTPPSLAAKIAGQDRSSIISSVQEALLEEYAPAAVAIDRNHEIIYYSGPTNRYLRQPRGEPTSDLLALLPAKLHNRVRGAIFKSNREEKPVTLGTTITGDDHRKRQVNLRISMVRDNLYLVVFREKSRPAISAGEPLPEGGAIDEAAVHQLEEELAATRTDLQNNIEELKSVNEELQASNEEFQAANEELETSREELQSLNEELITVNAQLQATIEDQEETNNDLNNFLASTSIPTLFLDRSFRVKRFTPAMSRFQQLIPSDVGRPISDLSQDGLGPDLIDDARQVMDNLAPVRKEICIDAVCYIRNVLPYRTHDNRIEGVVITYTDVSDLKKAEERNSWLASFPRVNPNPVLEVASSGKMNYANPGSRQILADLGMNPESVDLFLPADLPDLLRDLKKKEEACHYREIALKGKVFGATIHLVPQFDVARIYAFDVTERKRSEEEWERTFDSVPDLIALLDKEHRILRANRAMSELLGKGPEQCVGLKCFSCIHGTDKPLEACPHVMTLRDGQEHTAEVHEERLGGDYLVTATPLRDAAGEMIGSVHVMRDITERKRAEKMVLESEARLKRAQEIAHLGSWELDLVTDTLTWSDEVYRIFGLKPQEFGATYAAFLERVHPADRKVVEAAYSGSLREDRDTYEIEHRIVRHDNGEIRYVHEKCEHFRDEKGNIVRSVGMVHDITERRLAEEEVIDLNADLNRSINQLASANRELEAFSYSVSHDLRAPLRSITGFSQALLEDHREQLDEEGRDHLQRIVAGTNRMGKLIDDLLNLSRVSRSEMRHVRVNLSGMAEKIVAQLQESQPERRAEFRIAPDMNASGDPLLLQMVMENLLGNAFKFTANQPEAKIEFGVGEEDGKKVYFVRDNGAGFDMTYADKLFQPFQRLHSLGEFPGTGIGLATVRRIINRHGGTVRIEGEREKGAMVYFTL